MNDTPRRRPRESVTADEVLADLRARQQRAPFPTCLVINMSIVEVEMSILRITHGVTDGD